MQNICFETICVRSRSFLNIESHDRRFNTTRRDLWGKEEHLPLEAAILIPDFISNASYKCRVVYGPDIESIEWEPYEARKISSIMLVDDDTISYAYKFRDRSRLQYLMESKRECDEILIVKNGLITDTSIANVALFDGYGWFTPDLPLLPGTQRALLLDQGIIKERRIHISDLPRYSKIKLFNAMNPWSEAPVLNCSSIVQKV
jgi:4-amino-4-deoxychorismate lyase